MKLLLEGISIKFLKPIIFLIKYINFTFSKKSLLLSTILFFVLLLSFLVNRALATDYQVAYTSPGTYSWTAPAGVTSVSVVVIGPGGKTWNPGSSSGGGGGGLSYG